MRQQFIYENLNQFQKAKSLTIHSADFYQRTMKEYVDYYVKTKWRNYWSHAALRLWKTLSGIENFSQSINIYERNQYYKEVDKMTAYRESLISLSYSALLEDDSLKTTQASRAASLVHSALQFHFRLHHGDLPQDQIKNEPLEMGQYANIFGTHLVAKTKKQDIIYKTSETNYIILLRDGIFFRFDLPQPYSPIALHKAFEDFMQQSLSDKNALEGLTYLSGCRRDTVGQWTNDLLNEPANRQSFDILNNALFIVNFETSAAPTSRSELHRTVYSGNLQNRWFHTSLQIVVFENGQAGVVLSNRNYIDGNCGSRFASELYLGAKSVTWESHYLENTPANIQRLSFHIPAGSAQAWEREAKSYTRNSADYFKFDGIGQQNLTNDFANPDTLFMMALQMATTKQIKRHAYIIQLVNMSLYQGMGLNHALVSTQAMGKLIDHLNNEERDSEKTAPLLAKAIESYQTAQREARQGMPTIHILHYWLMKASIPQKIMALVLMKITGIAKCTTDAITSHPKIYPGVVSFGRPGIYIPYLSLFGLHYVIHENSIDLIYMPATGTTLDFKVLSSDIFDNLKKLQSLLCTEEKNHVGTLNQVSKSLFNYDLPG